jgi:Tfp pilus assembly protein PilO
MESFVIDALDRVSVRHDVKLESVTPGTVTQVVMFTELPYQVQVTGNYFSLFEWFRDVENELRPMVVKNFEMEKGRGSERIEMSLQIVAYRAEDET